MELVNWKTHEAKEGLKREKDVTIMKHKRKISLAVVIGVTIGAVAGCVAMVSKYGTHQYKAGYFKGEADAIASIISTIDEHGWMQIGDIGNSEGCMVIKEDVR